jgi:hypothetical protein
MKLADIPPLLKEALAVHEAFRKLAFTPDEIFIHPSTTKLRVVVIRGDNRFAVDVGVNTIPMAEFERTWGEAVEAWNTGKDFEQKAIWENSAVRRDAVGFVVALLDKGFAVREYT